MQHHGYVQYGCGLSAPASWTNFDASPTLRIQRLPLVGGLFTRRGPQFPQNVLFGDIIRGLPIEPASCQGLYCSHVLEHLSLDDLRTALKNSFASLKPGGIFRLVLPDLEESARQYLASKHEQPAIHFMEETSLGKHQRPRGLSGVMREWYGNSKHLWMWDYPSLAAELKRVGFTDIRRAAFGDSSDPHFKDVEDADRWDKCLGIECKKPV